MIRRMCTHIIQFIGCTTHIRFWPSIEILYGVFKKKKMKFHQWIIWGESTQPARAPKHQQKKTQRNSLSMMVRGDFCFGVFFFSIRPHHIHIDRELYTAMAGGRIFKNPLKSFSIMVMIVYVRYTYSLFIIYAARDRLRLSVIGSDQKGNMLTHIFLFTVAAVLISFDLICCVRVYYLINEGDMNHWPVTPFFSLYLISFLPHLMRFKFNEKSMRCGLWLDVYVICIHPKKEKEKRKKVLLLLRL
jgi:hypothetical protein